MTVKEETPIKIDILERISQMPGIYLEQTDVGKAKAIHGQSYLSFGVKGKADLHGSVGVRVMVKKSIANPFSVEATYSEQTLPIELCIEVKTPKAYQSKNQGLNPDQITWRDAAIERGAIYFVSYSPDHAEQELRHVLRARFGQ